MKRRIFFIPMIMVFIRLGVCQVADFTFPSSACINETILLKNNSVSATRYLWDFCHDALPNISGATSAYAISSPGVIIPEGIEAVNDNGNWYVFFFGRNENTLYRLSYGADINNTSPTITSLGNLGSFFNLPTHIKIVKEGSSWYGFVVNFGDGNLIKLNFGNSLSVGSGSISTTNLSSQGLANCRGFDMINSEDGYVVLLSAWGGGQLKAIRFSNGLANAPTDVRSVSTSISSGMGISLIKSSNQWIGLVSDFNSGNVVHCSFGPDLFNNSFVPVLTTVASLSNPRDLKLVQDGLEYYALVESTLGLTVIEFGDDVLAIDGTEVVTYEGNFGGKLTDPMGITLLRNGATWNAFTISQNSGLILRLDFTDNCSPSSIPFKTITDTDPIGKFFQQAGNYMISLVAYNSSGGFDIKDQLITVTSSVAPDLILSNDNNCLGVTNHFVATTSNATTLSNGSWDLAGNTATGNTASYQFVTTGEYEIIFNGTTTNGCANMVSRTISIYNPPISGFTLPIASPVLCTNQSYTFANTSASDPGSNISWQWSIDGLDVSDQKDLIKSFPNTNNQSVQLTASIPGCSSQTTQVFAVQAQGPTTNFFINGKCEQTNVQFINQTSGAVTSYVWDFGDGSNQNATDANHTYLSAGSFDVKLVATNASGCNNSSTKALTIYSSPQPNFSLDLPPFSCSGTPSQFNDLTPSPTDSNLSSWAWSFGDAGTSTDRNPLHTFTNSGDYNVSLTTTTNFGCSASFQKPVTITASPAADFTYTPACINQGTRFTDASGSGVKSWFWTIGGSTYAFSNPTHVFSGSGGFSAKLTVTGNNNCVASVTKTINVPVAPSLSFSVDNACEKQAANFKDTSPANTDPAASWSWDFAGQGTATGNAAQYAFASAGSYSVKMTSTQQSGCVYSLSKNVTINATPVAAFTSSPEWGVPPLAVQFTNTSTGANSYSWHFNDKNNSTSTLASPGFLFTDLGDYVVDLVATSALGCSGSTSGKISVIIPSLDLELKQLQVVKDPASNVYRIFVTVKNKSNYLLTSVDVVVDISGNALIKETINTNLLPDAEIVQLLNNQILPHGNLLTYLCASIEVDNDNDPFNNSKCEPVEEEVVIFNPYPNPSNGAFRFEWIAPTTDNAHFEIFNAMGQLAFEQYAESVQVGLNQVQFDLSNLNTGAYYFRFSSNSVSKTLPIQIVR